MVGRPLLSELDAVSLKYDSPESARRRQVLRETITRFEQCPSGDRYQSAALANLARWRAEAAPSAPRESIKVIPGDWGEVTRGLTRQYGECFAVLNMANAYVPGGSYVEGAIAQEENMFRRTDCHFYVAPPHYDEAHDRYHPDATRLLSAEDGLVYLDTDNPRVCIRGPEARDADDLGYPWLPESEIFPFYELRAAAQDLRGGLPFDPIKARRQIAAQLETLRIHGVRHAILGAFGCGAFRNPAAEVASIYRQEIERRADDFNVIAFAIFDAGYGPDNYTPFALEFNAALQR